MYALTIFQILNFDHVHRKVILTEWVTPNASSILINCIVKYEGKHMVRANEIK